MHQDPTRRGYGANQYARNGRQHGEELRRHGYGEENEPDRFRYDEPYEERDERRLERGPRYGTGRDPDDEDDERERYRRQETRGAGPGAPRWNRESSARQQWGGHGSGNQYTSGAGYRRSWDVYNGPHGGGGQFGDAYGGGSLGDPYRASLGRHHGGYRDENPYGDQSSSGSRDPYRGSSGADDPYRTNPYGGGQPDPYRGGSYGRYGQAQGFGGPEPQRFRGPKGYRRSDERIREDVSDQLAMIGDWSDVEVTVHDGEVTLSGIISDRQMKYHAEQLCERIPGVREINNHLRVRRQDASLSGYGQDDRSEEIPKGKGSVASNTTTGPTKK